MAARQSALEKKIKDAVTLLEKNGYTITPPSEPITIDTTELNKCKLEARRQAFIEELRKYQGTYSNTMLNEFYVFWSEANKSFTKMRFELQSTFEIGRRLATWAKRSNNRYGTKQITDTDRANKLADILVG